MKLLVILIVLAFATVGCMSVPTGLHVYESPDGCTSTDVCPWGRGKPRNFYHVPTRQIVLAPNQPLKVAAHEACHAHQHQQVIDELDIEPSIDLDEWYDTREARDYAAVVEAGDGVPWDVQRYSYSLLEDFAEACGRFLVQDKAWPTDVERSEFFAERGFR